VIKVPLASTGFRQNEIEAVARVLSSGNLTMGSEVAAFESEMAQYLGVEHFVMVNSGSSANLLMIEALLRPSQGSGRMSSGDGVLVPAIAWPTTIWPLIQLGLTPVFVDIDPNTLAMDLSEAKTAIKKFEGKITGIFPIHPLGLALQSEELDSFAKEFNLTQINDVCESLGAWADSYHAGTKGLMSSFSFYFSHHITTMEGGGIATNELDLANDLRSMRSHGWSRDRTDSRNWHQGFSHSDSKFVFVTTGYNVRPMEIQAAAGRTQLRSLGAFVDRRREIVQMLYRAIAGTSLRIIGYERFLLNPRSHSWMLVPIQITCDSGSKKRQDLLESLEELNIETRPVLTGNFLSQPAMRRIGPEPINPEDFPQATKIAETSFLVSCHHDLTDSQISHLGESLRKLALSIF